MSTVLEDRRVPGSALTVVRLCSSDTLGYSVVGGRWCTKRVNYLSTKLTSTITTEESALMPTHESDWTVGLMSPKIHACSSLMLRKWTAPVEDSPDKREAALNLHCNKVRKAGSNEPTRTLSTPHAATDRFAHSQPSWLRSSSPHKPLPSSSSAAVVRGVATFGSNGR